MKYTNEVTINAPRQKVIELFENQENMAKWQPGFVSMKLISGEAGAVGSTYEMNYKMGKRDIQMVETITESNFPEVFSATYEAKNVWNLVRNHFEVIDETTTRYWTDCEFKMKGIMKVMAFLMPRAFKKQSQKYADLFKEFVEKELSAS